jgi:hypothetical protein
MRKSDTAGRTTAIGRAAASVIGLTAVSAAAWIAGWGLIAALAALGAFALGAATAGTDTRSAGNWTPRPR